MNKTISGCALRFKGANNILLGGALLITFAVFFSGKSLRAQMASLYSQSNDQVAGISSLMSAVANNDVEGVKFFSKAGAAFVNQKNLGGATALHIAAREKNLEIAKTLVENGADVNVSDNEGWTPLMRATLAADSALVSFLLEKNASAAAVNSANESVITQAAMSDCDACLSALFEKFNFIKLMDVKLLTQQINDSYTIARNHENTAMQKLLGDYLDRLTKMSALSDATTAESSQVIDLGTSDVTRATPAIPTSSKSSLKRFRFVGSSSGKISSVEQVEPISIQKKDVANITSEAVVKEETLQAPKVSYKFVGQSKTSSDVQSGRERMKEIISEKQKADQVKMSAVSDVVASPAKTENRVFKFKKMETDEKVSLVTKDAAAVKVQSVGEGVSSPVIPAEIKSNTPAVSGVFKFKQGEPSKVLEKKKVVPAAVVKKSAAPAKQVQSFDLDIPATEEEVAN